MPAHWLQVKSWRAGFKSDEKASFYPSKNALFSEGTMNTEPCSASDENVKVIEVGLASGPVRCTYVGPKQME